MATRVFLFIFVTIYDPVMTVMTILGRIRIKVSSCDLGVSVYRLVQLQNTLLFTLLFKICVTVLGPLLWD